MTTLTPINFTDIDETLGPQKDDAVLSGSIIAEINAVLPGGLTVGDAIETAYDAAADMEITGTTGRITGLSFVDSTGAPLSGVDSGMTTLDGEPILLNTSSDEDVVLGTTADGTVVFAIHMTEIPGTTPTGEATITGANFAIVLFEPIWHTENPNPDDFKDLTNKLYVAAEENLDFDFGGAPAGQNVFMMFGNENEAIVVTGLNPDADTSDKDKTGDTVNSGKGGGPTTLGSNGQQLKPGTGLTFTYVEGANTKYTVPGLSSKEAKSEANIDFDSFIASTGGHFDIVQVNPTGQLVDINIRAYHDTDNVAEDQEAYVEGMYEAGDDEVIDISGVTINGAAIDPSRIIVNADQSWTILDVADDDRVEFTTAMPHDRVSISSAEPEGSNKSFDIGGFGFTKTSTDKGEVGSHLRFYDDGPGFAEDTDTISLTTDETNIPDSDGPADVSQMFSPQYGRDGAGSVDYTLEVSATGATGLVHTDSGDPVVLSQVSATEVVGMAGAVEVLRITLSGSDLSMTLSAAVMHPDTGDHNDSKSLTADAVSVVAKVTDGDGDWVTESRPVGDMLFILDDGPSVTEDQDAPGLAVDDSDFATDDSDTGYADMFSIDFGADGEGDVEYDLLLLSSESGLTDTLTGAPMVLSIDNGDVIGTAGEGGPEVLRVSVDPDTGEVTLDQSRSVVHDDPDDPEEEGASAAFIASGAIELKVTATDGDGDQHSLSRDIGTSLHFYDDGPVLSLATDDPTNETGDDAIPDPGNQNAVGDISTDDYSLYFVPDYGNDGKAETTPIAYDVYTTDGTPSGVFDLETEEPILLYNNPVTSAVEGRISTGEVCFLISVNPDGLVSQEQKRTILHTNPDDPNEVTSITEKTVWLKATITDGDGDQDDNQVDISATFAFRDDGPTVIQVNDPPVLYTDDTFVDDPSTDTGDFSNILVVDPGNDGAGPTSWTFSLGDGVASGLTDTLSGETVQLSVSEDGSTVTGYVTIEGADETVFTLVMNTGTGFVTQTQLRSVVHNDPDDHQEEGDSAAMLAAGAVIVTVQATDADGDHVEQPFNVGESFRFLDDGPSIGTGGEIPLLETDDTGITDTDAGGFAGIFAPDHGEDGPGDITYELGIGAAATGLTDSLTDTAVVLSMSSGDVVGMAGGEMVLRIAVDGDTGAVTLTQYRAVKQFDTTNHDEAIVMATGAVTMTATITDGDNDSDNHTRDIGGAFSFRDDGPSVSTSNLIGSGTNDVQYGEWQPDGGKDGLAGFSLSFDGYTKAGAAGTGSISLSGPDGDGVYTGMIIDDFNNDGEADELDFLIDLNADGTYTFQVTSDFGSTTTLSTEFGSLDAGGPSPARTLTIPNGGEDEDIIFFNVQPLASDSDIESLIPLTEDQIEAGGYSFLGTEDMNVSTSGIGLGNNNFNGYGDGPSPDDESFVINPETPVTSVVVHIDNSVQGYDNPPEELSYRTLDVYGDWSDWETVEGNLGVGNQAKTFEIFDPQGDLIDAVQLRMDDGVVKIPVIEFKIETESIADNLSLAFTATVEDNDGDTASSSFNVDIATDDDPLAGGDLMMNDHEWGGLDDQADVFNFDFDSAPADETEQDFTWDVYGMDAGVDTMVLLGVSAGDVTLSATADDDTVTATVDGAQKEIIVHNGADLLTLDDFIFV